MEVRFEEEGEVRSGVETLGEVKKIVVRKEIEITTLGAIEVNSGVITVRDKDIMHLNVENQGEIRIEIEKRRRHLKLTSHRHKMMNLRCYSLSVRRRVTRWCC